MLRRRGLSLNASVVPLNFSVAIKPLLRSIDQYRFLRGVVSVDSAVDTVIGFADFEEMLAGTRAEGDNTAFTGPRFASM